MVPFDLWGPSLVLALIYSAIIIIPCILVALVGRKLIYQLGQYPSKSPITLMDIYLQLVALEIITFIFLIGFYHVFAD